MYSLEGSEFLDYGGFAQDIHINIFLNMKSVKDMG